MFLVFYARVLVHGSHLEYACCKNTQNEYKEKMLAAVFRRLVPKRLEPLGHYFDHGRLHRRFRLMHMRMLRSPVFADHILQRRTTWERSYLQRIAMILESDGLCA